MTDTPISDAIRAVQLSSPERMGEAIDFANAIADREFNRRVAAEAREIQLGEKLEEARSVQRRMRSNLERANDENSSLRKRVADLEAELRRVVKQARAS